MIFTEQYPELAAKAAENAYRELHLNCAESVFMALLTSCGEECPLSLLKAAGGFGGGMGGAGCTCGALSGSVMAAGYLFGRTSSTGEAPELCGQVAKKLHDAFRDIHHATCCRVLNHGLTLGTPEQKDSCALRTGQTAELAARIIMEAAKGKEDSPAIS
ncbi:MAG: C_GCAxxG_C_C family protein [Mailhella sp.]|nr:C_GCAxxG_C_C family protein [Mailhella sp.]